VVTLTARHRISRRAMIELARALFGVTPCGGVVDGICPARLTRVGRSANYGSYSNKPARSAGAPAGTGGSRTTCSRVWLALWTFTAIDGVEPTNNPPRVRSEPGSSTEERHLIPKARTVSDPLSAHSRPPPPAACNVARCLSTSAN
jgi:hypothetical protein